MGRGLSENAGLPNKSKMKGHKPPAGLDEAARIGSPFKIVGIYRGQKKIIFL